jgi:serpin B
MQRINPSSRRDGMLTRRNMLRSMGLLGAVAAAPPLLSGCGDSAAPPETAQKVGISKADLSRHLGGGAARPAAVAAVQAFTVDLYQRIAGSYPGNLICSPYSVAVALAMARNGARGQTATEMDHVLRASDLPRFNEGMDSLTLLIDGRAGEYKRFDGSKAMVSMDVANSLWGQRGEAWEQPFLDNLARYYATGMRQVDYRRDAESARLAINHWTSRRTHGKIPELLPPHTLDTLTRLVLVNAIYFKAPWEHPFGKYSDETYRFSLSDGRRISAAGMRYSIPVVLSEGRDWRAIRLSYAGRKLAMTVIVPSSSLADLERSLDAGRLVAMLADTANPQELMVTLPKWKFRLTAELTDPLSALGMPTAFDPVSSDFSGMTRQEPLHISAVQHEAFIAVDKQGTEAAAATAAIMAGGSATEPPAFIVDRPFLFVIHDVDTATPLFIGRVSDPSAT